MRRIIHRLFVVVSAILLGVEMVVAADMVEKEEAVAHSHEYVSATIYYFGWDVLTRTRLELEDVRRSPKIKIIVFDKYEIDRLIDFLGVEDLKKVQSPEKAKYANDPRLVVDLYDSGGVSATYYASRTSLLTADSTFARDIDELFRHKFTFGAKWSGAGRAN